MPIRGDESISGEFGAVRINIDGQVLEVLFAGIPIPNDDPAKAEFVRQAIQDQIDGVGVDPDDARWGSQRRVNTLPQDDENRTTDPAKPWLFWLPGVNPTTLQERPFLITNVHWDFVRLLFQYSIERTRPL